MSNTKVGSYKRHAMFCFALYKLFYQVQSPMLPLYVAKSHKIKGIFVYIEQ